MGGRSTNISIPSILDGSSVGEVWLESLLVEKVLALFECDCGVCGSVGKMVGEAVFKVSWI